MSTKNIKKSKRILLAVALLILTVLVINLAINSELKVVKNIKNNMLNSENGSVVKNVDYYVIDGEAPFEDNDEPRK